MTAESITPIINKLLLGVAVLAFLAMIDTAWLTYMHYAPEVGEFCTINDQLDCQKVNSSPWSMLNLGFVVLPVAGIAFVYYTILMVGAIGIIKKWKFQKIHKILRQGVVLQWLRYFGYLGLIFTLYLTYIEAFKLQTFCIFCVIQQILIIGIVALFLRANKYVKDQKEEGEVCEFC